MNTLIRIGSKAGKTKRFHVRPCHNTSNINENAPRSDGMEQNALDLLCRAVFNELE